MRWLLSIPAPDNAQLQGRYYHVRNLDDHIVIYAMIQLISAVELAAPM